jgi:hypothetical protein
MHAQDHSDWHTIAAAEGTSAFNCPFDCMAGVPDDYDEDVVVATPAATVKTIHHVAKFHRAAWADNFAARIREPGWSATNIVRKKGNIVEFDAATSGDDGWTHWADWALTVGYYGSPMNPGFLDGRRAIPSY